MATIDDLKKSITELDEREVFKVLQIARAVRRDSLNNKKARKSTPKKKASKKKSPDELIKGLSQSEIEELIKMLEEDE